MDGQVNACAEGIIATCKGDKVTWKVCDGESACEADWQVEGAFRCSQSEPMPELTEQSGTPDADEPQGTGANPDHTPQGTGTNPNGAPGTSCSEGSLCQLAELGAGRGAACAITIASGSVYILSDNGGVWSVPKSGGPLKSLATAMRALTQCGIEVAGDNVYFGGATTVETVPASGGNVTVVSNNYLAGLTSDAAHVYWGTTTHGVDRLTVANGGVDSLSASGFDGQFLRANGTSLLWANFDGSQISILPKNGGSPSVLTLGTARATRMEADETQAFIIDSAGQRIASVVLANGQVIGLVTAETAQTLGLSDTGVYYGDSSTLDRIAKSGGASSRVAAMGVWLVKADATHVFFVDWNRTKLYRAPR